MASILVIGAVTAGVSMANVDNSIDIDNDKLTLIKNKVKVDLGLDKAPEIEPDVYNPTCTADKCKFKVYQEGVINSEIMIQTYWIECTELNETTNECETEVRHDLTDLEIRDALDNKVKNKLENWADAIEQRSANTEEKSIGGKLDVS